ncbi:hypothetical protein MHU86_20518 [Fragilaria crotonensis]|nr:hypothetical protein MHU86_20518 [Fragilaria crotonensis]
MLDGEPKCGVGDVRPMDGRMQHHGSCDRHDGSDVAFGDPIVMVSADAGESDDLLELGEVARELADVNVLSCRRDTLAASLLCCDTFAQNSLCLERFVGVQTYLMLHKNKPGGVVNEDNHRYTCRRVSFSSGGK